MLYIQTASQCVMLDGVNSRCLDFNLIFAATFDEVLTKSSTCFSLPTVLSFSFAMLMSIKCFEKVE